MCHPFATQLGWSSERCWKKGHSPLMCHGNSTPQLDVAAHVVDAPPPPTLVVLPPALEVFFFNLILWSLPTSIQRNVVWIWHARRSELLSTCCLAKILATQTGKCQRGTPPPPWCARHTRRLEQLAKIGNRKLCEAQFGAELRHQFVVATWTHTSEASTGKLFRGRVRWCVRVDLRALPLLVIRDDVENDGACHKAREVHCPTVPF